jgi:hypothetical protein
MISRNQVIIALVLKVLLISACGSAFTENPPTQAFIQSISSLTATPSTTFTQPAPTRMVLAIPIPPSDTPVPRLKGPYLGQEPPGMKPELCTWDHYNSDTYEYSGAFFLRWE